MMMMMINVIMMTTMILDIGVEQLSTMVIFLKINHPRTNNESQKTPDNQL